MRRHVTHSKSTGWSSNIANNQPKPTLYAVTSCPTFPTSASEMGRGMEPWRPSSYTGANKCGRMRRTPQRKNCSPGSRRWLCCRMPCAPLTICARYMRLLDTSKLEMGPRLNGTNMSTCSSQLRKNMTPGEAVRGSAHRHDDALFTSTRFQTLLTTTRTT